MPALRLLHLNNDCAQYRLLTGNCGHFNYHDINTKLKIGVQLNDIEIALEERLLAKGSFYRSLVNYVQ